MQQDSAEILMCDNPSPALPLSLDGWAVFLDVDGTLLDLADRPDGIVVPEGLPGHIAALAAKVEGALALVTGRSIAVVDRLFTPQLFPVAGLHGAERRNGAGQIHSPVSPDALDEVRAALTAFSLKWPGTLVEDKGAAVSLHYRLAPEAEAAAHAEIRQLQAALGPDWVLQPGKMVFELRPAATDKGRAIEIFLTEEPFAGRRPLVIGDDVTDEAMFHTANARGGLSVRVGAVDRASAAILELPSPAAVRDWIAEAAR